MSRTRSFTALIPELQRAASQFLLDLLTSEDLVKIADNALINGTYSPALAQLATARNPIMSDVGPLFLKAIEELGGELPTRLTATRIALTAILQKISARELPPRHTLAQILPLDDRTSRGDDPLGITQFVGFYWAYDYLECSPDFVTYNDVPVPQALEELDKDVIRAANAWLAANESNPPPLNPVAP